MEYGLYCNWIRKTRFIFWYDNRTQLRQLVGDVVDRTKKDIEKIQMNATISVKMTHITYKRNYHVEEIPIACMFFLCVSGDVSRQEYQHCWCWWQPWCCSKNRMCLVLTYWAMKFFQAKAIDKLKFCAKVRRMCNWLYYQTVTSCSNERSILKPWDSIWKPKFIFNITVVLMWRRPNE